MKKCLSLFIVLTCLYCMMPKVVMAEEQTTTKAPQGNSESSGAADKSSGYTANCSGSTCTGIVTDSKSTGVRITFVDENGIGVTSSFDFLTYYSGGPNNLSNFTIVKNVVSGDKSKMSGKFTRGKGKIKDIPMLSSLIKEFNSYTETDSTGKKVGVTKSSLSTSGNTGASLATGFDPEVNWFTGLTDSNNANYRVDVNGLIHAISKIYPEFNASNFIMELEKGCQEGKNIFIQMEPMYLYWKSASSEEGFGTIRDLVQIWPNEWKDHAREKAYSFIHYPAELQKVEFKGYKKFEPGYTITNDSQINDKIGYAVALDWANDATNYCNQCVFNVDEQQMYYQDELVLKFESPFTNLYEYTLSESPGLNCCGALTEFKNNNQLNDEWNEYYDFYCDSDTGEPCTTKEPPEGGEPIYYCPDGEKGIPCDEDTFKEQCGPPCDNNPGGPEDPENACCKDDPIKEGYIEGVVNNCCADGTKSEAKEYDLDKLFCNNEYLGVDNFQYKCKADYYVDSTADVNSQYCKMFCTERVSVEIPGAITAISGRYFKLTETSKGTKSSYIEGFKRCRLIIQYDDWEKDYYEIVKAEEEAYNAFQYNKAFELMYEDAIKASTKETEKVTVSQSCTTNTTSTSTVKSCSTKKAYEDYDLDKEKCYSVTITKATTAGGKDTISISSATCKGSGTNKDKDTCYVTTNSTSSSTTSSTCTIKYTKYPFKKMYDIYNVKINDKLRDECENIYDAIEFKAGKKTSTSHNLDWSADHIDISDCESAVKDKTGTNTTKTTNSTSTTTCTASRSDSEAENHQEDVEKKKDEYAAAATKANDALKSNAQLAKQMEETIDKCDKYFTDFKGANTSESYKFEASQRFSYTQVYMDDLGKLQMDEIFVDFKETPGCKVDEKVITNVDDKEDGLSKNRYSTNKYGTGKEKMTDFSTTDLSYKNTANGYTDFLDETYEADKIFTTDAKYHATCSWDEGDNTLYTLVPNGSASESTSEMNYTTHNQEYKVHLSTLDGTYETYWDITGLGTNGRFDKHFKEAGKTCSGQMPNESEAQETLTCKLHSEYEVVLTGYCNGSNNTDTTANPEDCDPYEEGYRLFNFKVVDPANLFPSGVSTVDGDIAYNWVEADLGKKAMQEIQAAGAADKTYAPDNLTYSYVLTPTDMGHIKNYNAGQVDNGGYSDFTLVCSTESCKAGACDKCKSPFLENLANGTVRYDSADHTVSGWGNKNQDLTSIRKNNGWN